MEEVLLFHPNGERMELRTVRVGTDGTRVDHGPYQRWFKNGSLAEEGSFADGKRTGEWKEFHKNGKKKSRGSFENGLRVGAWRTWFERGGLASRGSYSEGYREGKWIVRKTKDVDDEARSGLYRISTLELRQGHLVAKGSNLNGKAEARWTFTWPNGVTFLEGEFEAGLATGPWVLRLPSGKTDPTWVTGHYLRGVRKRSISDAISPDESLPQVVAWPLAETDRVALPSTLEALFGERDEERGRAKKNSFDATAVNYRDRIALAQRALVEAAWGADRDDVERWRAVVELLLGGGVDSESHWQLLEQLGPEVLEGLRGEDSERPCLTLALIPWDLEPTLPVRLVRTEKVDSRVGRTHLTALYGVDKSRLSLKSGSGFGLRLTGEAATRALGGQGTMEPLDLALAWLAKSMDENGTWSGSDERLRCGLSARVLLALAGNQNTMEKGEHRQTVTRGQWGLRQLQDTETGAFVPASIQRDTEVAPVLQHALAVQALAEISFFSKPDPILDVPLRKGIDWLLDQMDAKGAFARAVGAEGDRATTAAALFALAMAAETLPDLNQKVWEKAKTWLREETPRGGRIQATFGLPAHERSDDLSQAVLIWLAGYDPTFGVDEKERAKRMGSLSEYLQQGVSDNSREPLAAPFFLVYGALAAFQMGGRTWRDWNQITRDMWIQAMEKRGSKKGTWMLTSDLDPQTQRILSTALGAMALEVYGRYGRPAR